MKALGPYRFRKKIRASRQGEVFLARDAESGDTFVVRVFPRDAEDERCERALYDAKAATALDDPRIERTVDAGRIEGRSFIASAAIKGPSLAEALRSSGPLSANEVIRIGLDLADTLARAHAHGVVHRNLEPGYITLAGKERAVRLGGFGLAALLESAPGVRDPKEPATPYLAPEQARGEHADHHADIYALGAVLWEALTGVPPTSPPDTSRLPEGTPALLPHLLLALLSPDAGARPAALSEQARAFRELLAIPEMPAEAAPSGPERASADSAGESAGAERPRLSESSVATPPSKSPSSPSIRPWVAAVALGAGALVYVASRLAGRKRRSS